MVVKQPTKHKGRKTTYLENDLKPEHSKIKYNRNTVHPPRGVTKTKTTYHRKTFRFPMIVAEVSGSVLEVNPKFVKIKLGETTTVNFPKALFENKDFIQYGQKIKYQIIENHDGIRHQDFVKNDDIKTNDKKKVVYSKINKLKNQIGLDKTLEIREPEEVILKT